MKRPLLMPKLGLTMTEGVLVEWAVRPGEAFAAQATLFVVETEKTATDVPAEGDGRLVDVVVAAGETVPVGAVLGYWEDGAHEAELAGPAAAPGLPAAAQQAPAATASPPHADSAPRDPAAVAGRLKATPLARRVARLRGIDLATVVGRGPGGRIREADVEAAASRSFASGSLAVPTPAAASGAPTVPRTAGELRPPSPIQATMARRLTAAKREIPHFYLALEAEVSRVLALRTELRAARPEFRCTLTHFVLAAVGRALVQTPEANVVWTDGGLLHLPAADVGLAVATDRGLVAPVLRDIGSDSLAAIAGKAARLIERARAGRLAASDLDGGAITVSNAGMHDVTWMTSIINPGQSLILGVGSVRALFRPDSAGAPALRREVGLVLSADHRVHDAVGALAFLKRVVAHLESPLGLVL